MNLTTVLDSSIDDTTKGVPGGTTPFKLGDIAAQGWNLLAEDLPLPVLVIRRSALEHNLKLMSDFCSRHGVLIAPHGKTTMAPQLFAEQIQHGAWGITAASIEQVQVFRAFGVQRIVLANEVIGEPNLRYLTEQLAGDDEFDFYCWVDSPQAVKALHEAAVGKALARPVQVLLEIGWQGGRTGARDDKAVDEVANAIGAADGYVQLVGISAFEGLLGLAHRGGAVAGAAAGGDAGSFLERVTGVAARLAAKGLLPDDYLLTGGGSTSFDAVVEAFGPLSPPARVLLRSGCYITHDHGMNADLSPLSATAGGRAAQGLGTLEPALELWAYVNSVPEPGLAFLTFGRRDAPEDSGLPVPLARIEAGAKERLPLTDAEVSGLNDQHCYLRHKPGDLHVGDRVVLGISHPCTAFDKWRLIPVVDDDYNVLDAIRTFF